MNPSAFDHFCIQGGPPESSRKELRLRWQLARHPLALCRPESRLAVVVRDVHQLGLTHPSFQYESIRSHYCPPPFRLFHPGFKLPSRTFSIAPLPDPAIGRTA
jgi:hypothetical protein